MTPLKLAFKIVGYKLHTSKFTITTGDIAGSLDQLDLILEVDANKQFKFGKISSSGPKSIADWYMVGIEVEIKTALRDSHGAIYDSFDDFIIPDSSGKPGGFGEFNKNITSVICKIGGTPMLIVPKSIIPQGKSTIKLTAKGSLGKLNKVLVIGKHCFKHYKGYPYNRWETICDTCCRFFKPFITLNVRTSYISQFGDKLSDYLDFIISIPNPPGFNQINTLDWNHPLYFHSSECDQPCFFLDKK